MNDIIQKQLIKTNVSLYHNLGFKGKGITILNHEKDTDHAKMTTNILKLIAPESTIINTNIKSGVKSGKLQYFYFEIDGVDYTPEDMYNKFHPNIMSVSFGGNYSNDLSPQEEILQTLVDKGLVICCASANDGSDGVNGKYKNIDITIGACQFINDEIKRVYYSSYDKDRVSVDFMAFLATGSGTSASTPFFAGMCALLMCRYGNLNQKQVLNIFKDNALDIQATGVDNETGYGVAILPTEVNMSEYIENKFTDIKRHWAENYINYCVQNGLMNGYEDKTFKPNNQVTRAELATIIYRLCNKIEVK